MDRSLIYFLVWKIALAQTYEGNDKNTCERSKKICKWQRNFKCILVTKDGGPLKQNLQYLKVTTGTTQTRSPLC